MYDVAIIGAGVIRQGKTGPAVQLNSQPVAIEGVRAPATIFKRLAQQIGIQRDVSHTSLIPLPSRPG